MSEKPKDLYDVSRQELDEMKEKTSNIQIKEINDY